MTTEERIKALEDEIASLKAEYKKKEKVTRFEPNKEDYYAFVSSLGRVVFVTCYDKEWDEARKNYNNIFRESSKTNIQHYIDNVIKVQNRLMQLHEELCPEHIPDWKNKTEEKAYAFYDCSGGIWNWTASCWRDENVVVFPVSVMNTVVKILNDEKFMYKERK